MKNGNEFAKVQLKTQLPYK